MTTSSIQHRYRTENSFYRALLARLQALVPPDTPAATLLEASRPTFEALPEPPRWPSPVDDLDPVEDPITAALRHEPHAAELAHRQRQLAAALRHSVTADAWRTFLAFESTTHEHAHLLEAIVFEHAFRLGQLYPAASATDETTRDPILRRLARAATDMRSPPGQRLRVLLGAAMLAVEELYPQQSPAG